VLADVSVANALVHPEELDTFLSRNRKAFRSFKPFSWEGRFVIKGEIRWMRVQSTPSVMENGDIRWFGIAQDITDRKRAEEALALERDRAQKYLDIVGSIIVALDTKGRVQLINKAGCEILGYDEAEIIGKNWIDTFLPAGSRAEVRETFGALTAGQLEPFQQVENQVLTKAGEERIISWHNVGVTDEASRITGTLSSGQDVTDRKRAEEKLRESEEKYRLLFDSSDVLVSVYDRQGVCQLMNRKVAALFGGEPEAFIGKSFDELHPEAAQEYARRIRQAIDSGLAQEYEDEVRFSQGKRWLLSRVHPVPDAYGEFHTAQIISHDITERKRAEERLRESEKKYRLLVESLNEGIWYIDREACTTFVNPRMADMLGYTVEEMQGKHLFEFMDERGEEIARQNLERREKGFGEQHDFEFIRKDGRRIYTSLEATPILADDGRYLGALAGVQDITERRQAEVALHHYADRLRILHEIDAAILAAQSPPAIARAALERLHDIIPYHRASISQIDLPRQRSRELVILTAEGPVEIPASSWQSFSKVGALVETVQQGRTHLVQDIAALETTSALEQALATIGVRAYASVPMVVQEELLGTLNLAVASPDFFRPDHVETLEEIAASLAVALQQARLLEQTQQDAEAKAMLLREVNHRVMNNLSMILYILDMEQQRDLEDKAGFQAALQDVTTRIQGIATVHRMLSTAQQNSLDLGQVVSQIIQAALSGSPIQDRLQVRVDGPEVPLNLSAKQAITVALIINELTTNSIKYAFQDRSQGQIQVQITVLDGHRVRLFFRDDGPGLPDEVLAGERQNVGLWLVEASVTHTLRGEFEFWNDAGAVAAFIFEPAPVDLGV
jgi:PAS domain S-box-containing protein